MERRHFLALAALGAAGASLPQRLAALTRGAKTPITVYKSPTCGCCGAWIDYINANGFVAQVIQITDQARMDEIKASSGVPVAMRSCHTALVGRYVVEGHVPADLITRMLRERPAGRGLAVPGMVTGSPGMETPGVPAQRYDVLLFQQDGTTRVYASR